MILGNLFNSACYEHSQQGTTVYTRSKGYNELEFRNNLIFALIFGTAVSRSKLLGFIFMST